MTPPAKKPEAFKVSVHPIAECGESNGRRSIWLYNSEMGERAMDALVAWYAKARPWLTEEAPR